MKVLMKVNLGSRDAARYGLDHAECTEGAVVEVRDSSVDEMLAKGFVATASQGTLATPKKQRPAKQKVVTGEAVKPKIANSPPATIAGGIDTQTTPAKGDKKDG